MDNNLLDQLDSSCGVILFPRELTVGTYNIFTAAIVVLLLSGIMPDIETDYVNEKTMVIYPVRCTKSDIYDYCG